NHDEQLCLPGGGAGQAHSTGGNLQALLRIYPRARRGTLVRSQSQESDCGVENDSASTCSGGPVLPASACTHAIGSMKYENVIDTRRDGTRRHIWLCADDYGMSPAANESVISSCLGGLMPPP